MYHQEYDDLLHATTPFSDEAVAAAKRHAQSAMQLMQTVAMVWGKKRWAMAVTPDHGGHINAEGKGDHCDDIPDDMDVTHFWMV